MKNTIIFGLHSVQSLIQKNPDRLLKLILSKDRNDHVLQQLMDFAKENRIKSEWVSRHELDQLTEKANHQGVVAFVKERKQYTEYDLELILEKVKKPLLLVLDTIQDPHNLGACLRSADAAGVDAVIAPRDKSVGMTSVVSKVASGAAETVPFIQVTNLARTLSMLKEKGIWVYGAAGEATQNVFEADLKVPLAIVLGSEGKGMRRLTREHCDVLLKIPMQGSVSSLNVSVAAGVFLFEAVRQRLGQ